MQHSALEPTSPLDQFPSQEENPPENPNRSRETDSSVGEISSTDETIPPPAERVTRSSHPRRAPRQDGAVTEIAAVRARLSTGYTRVPNELLMQIVGGELSRNEIKILLLVARMTISFNREFATLSKNVIERMTGIQGRAVLEALNDLETNGKLRKRPGDHVTPNRWALTCPPPDVKTSEGQKHPQDATGSRWLGENASSKKENLETIGNKTNSLSVFSETLRSYFAGLAPRRKREGELRAFGELREDYSEEQICVALEHLQKHGAEGSPCHSPMAYLGKAIGDVLSKVRLESEKKRERTERECAQAEAVRREQEHALLEDEQYATRKKAFESAYPIEQDRAEIVAELCRSLPFRPQGEAARRIAVGLWWEKAQGRTT